MTTTTTTKGLFDDLTTDELWELAGALVTRQDNQRGRFSSSRMAGMLAGATGADSDAFHTYRDIAREIGQLHGYVLDLYIARVSA